MVTTVGLSQTEARGLGISLSLPCGWQGFSCWSGHHRVLPPRVLIRRNADWMQSCHLNPGLAASRAPCELLGQNVHIPAHLKISFKMFRGRQARQSLRPLVYYHQRLRQSGLSQAGARAKNSIQISHEPSIASWGKLQHYSSWNEEHIWDSRPGTQMGVVRIPTSVLTAKPKACSWPFLHWLISFLLSSL